MATYLEVRAMINSANFSSRIQVALWIKATAILADGGSTAQAKAWANNTMRGAQDPDKMMRTVIRVASSPVGSSSGEAMTDAQLQTEVNNMVTELY